MARSMTGSGKRNHSRGRISAALPDGRLARLRRGLNAGNVEDATLKEPFMATASLYGKEVSLYELDTKRKLRVTLASVGNIDHGQNPAAPLYGTPSSSKDVDSLLAASDACCAYIKENGLGAGNWSGGDVFDEKQKLVARVSYNGRIWHAARAKPDRQRGAPEEGLCP